MDNVILYIIEAFLENVTFLALFILIILLTFGELLLVRTPPFLKNNENQYFYIFQVLKFDTININHKNYIE
jgi:hypothetical protein